MKCSTLGLIVGVVVALSARNGLASRKPADIHLRDSVHAEVKGLFSKTAAQAGEPTGFQITANGLTLPVEVSRAPLLRIAEQLEGKWAIVTGLFAEGQDGARVQRILNAETLGAGSATGSDEYIRVTVQGTLNIGVMAIGAETTGATITAGALTLELELRRDQRQSAIRLNGRKVRVLGELRQERGVEVRHRMIVKVQSIKLLKLQSGT
jgi:hypothetical protein